MGLFIVIKGRARSWGCLADNMFAVNCADAVWKVAINLKAFGNLESFIMCVRCLYKPPPPLLHALPYSFASLFYYPRNCCDTNTIATCNYHMRITSHKIMEFDTKPFTGANLLKEQRTILGQTEFSITSNLSGDIRNCL